MPNDVKAAGEDSEEVGSIAIRKIPKLILVALAESAKQNDRSLEAEARYALKSWIGLPANDQTVMVGGGEADRVIKFAADLAKVINVVSAQVDAQMVQPGVEYKLTIRFEKTESIG